MFSTLISVQELLSELNQDNLVILDCREDYKASHIPGARHVSLELDLSDLNKMGKGRHPLPSPEKLIDLFSRLGIDSETQVVVYDAADGSIAARAWWLLRYMQHESVAVLEGGWRRWMEKGLPISAVEKAPEPKIFVGSPRNEQWVDIEEAPFAPLLVDSRSPERYAGRIEPIDSVAGHIPGAKNRFFKENVDNQDSFLALDELQKQFRELFRQNDPSQVVFYCGSGVTACQNILAAVHAGFPQSKLFPGSWSEWTSKSRPIETSK